jgi:hypothetical protein
MASRRDGPEAPYPLRLRRAGAELVTSIQPKRSLEQRKHFVATLPALMAELTRGMKLVDWPEAAQDDFFGQLVTQHAGSLKGLARSDLDHNMMVRSLESAFRMPIPTAEESALAPAPTGSDAPVVEQRFSADEERAIGLISDHEVDWAVDLGGAAAPAHPATEAASAPSTSAEGDVPLPTLTLAGDPAAAANDAAAAKVELVESPELAPGAQLREHLQLGFSYQLNLKDQWQKVRLTYMSPARSLFLFSHGAKGRETISMTARTLGRLCEAGRMKAFETAFLLDRATQRARRQLAGADVAAAAR